MYSVQTAEYWPQRHISCNIVPTVAMAEPRAAGVKAGILEGLVDVTSIPGLNSRWVNQFPLSVAGSDSAFTKRIVHYAFSIQDNTWIWITCRGILSFIFIVKQVYYYSLMSYFIVVLQQWSAYGFPSCSLILFCPSVSLLSIYIYLSLMQSHNAECLSLIKIEAIQSVLCLRRSAFHLQLKEASMPSSSLKTLTASLLFWRHFYTVRRFCGKRWCGSTSWDCAASSE